MNRVLSFDLIRGLAALLVMLGHLRSIMFPPYQELSHPTIIDRLFYFITGYGYECVIIFFVLSGYFVGGAFMRNFQPTDLPAHIIKYSINRITRLWVVLIPALLLTLGLDLLGRLYSPTAAIYHDPNFFNFIHPSNDIRLVTLVGNLFFLQTVLVPTFGSNTPLWSLANEFWYYLLFPFLILCWYPSIQFRRKIIFFLISGCLCFFLQLQNSSMMQGFLIWLTGFGVYLIIPHLKINKLFSHFLILLFISTMVIIRSNGFPYQDLTLGIATGALLIGIGNFDFSITRWASEFLSKISYTLYLIHLPIIIFCKAVICPGKILQTTLEGYLIFVSLVLIILALSFAMYWLFERRTDEVKKYIIHSFGIKKSF